MCSSLHVYTSDALLKSGHYVTLVCRSSFFLFGTSIIKILNVEGCSMTFTGLICLWIHIYFLIIFYYTLPVFFIIFLSFSTTLKCNLLSVWTFIDSMVSHLVRKTVQQIKTNFFFTENFNETNNNKSKNCELKFSSPWFLIWLFVNEEMMFVLNMPRTVSSSLFCYFCKDFVDCDYACQYKCLCIWKPNIDKP